MNQPHIQLARWLSRRHGVDINKIMNRIRTRTERVLQLRHVVMFYLIEHEKWSYTQLGGELPLHHSTVMHAMRRDPAWARLEITRWLDGWPSADEFHSYLHIPLTNDLREKIEKHGLNDDGVALMLMKAFEIKEV